MKISENYYREKDTHELVRQNYQLRAASNTLAEFSNVSLSWRVNFKSRLTDRVSMSL